MNFERYQAMSDEQVVQLVRGGQWQLFELLMRRYNSRLYRVVRSVLRDDAEAEDTLQDTYLAALNHLDDVTGDTFGAWLRRIAVNEALRRARRAGASPFAETEMEEDEQPAPVPAPDRVLNSTQLREVMEIAIESLPDRLRQVFILRAVDGMSTNDTAELLGVPEDTVKTRLHRARGRLQHNLAAWADDAASQTFAFPATRCNRVVANVFARFQPPSR